MCREQCGTTGPKANLEEGETLFSVIAILRTNHGDMKRLKHIGKKLHQFLCDINPGGFDNLQPPSPLRKKYRPVCLFFSFFIVLSPPPPCISCLCFLLSLSCLLFPSHALAHTHTLSLSLPPNTGLGSNKSFGRDMKRALEKVILLFRKTKLLPSLDKPILKQRKLLSSNKSIQIHPFLFLSYHPASFMPHTALI